jgi:hypothetical protein
MLFPFMDIAIVRKKVTRKLYNILPSINITCRKKQHSFVNDMVCVQYEHEESFEIVIFCCLANIFSIFMAIERFIDIENQYTNVEPWQECG